MIVVTRTKICNVDLAHFVTIFIILSTQIQKSNIKTKSKSVGATLSFRVIRQLIIIAKQIRH